MKFINGYDGCSIMVGDRVELHPGCDLWAAGARFAQVTRIDAVLCYATVTMDIGAKVRRFHETRLKRVC